MARNEKKKMSFADLERHAILWGTFRIEELKEMEEDLYFDKNISDEEKDVVYGSIAEQLVHLVAFMGPLRHDEQSLMEWAHEFIDENHGPIEVN